MTTHFFVTTHFFIILFMFILIHLKKSIFGHNSNNYCRGKANIWHMLFMVQMYRHHKYLESLSGRWKCLIDETDEFLRKKSSQIHYCSNFNYENFIVFALICYNTFICDKFFMLPHLWINPRPLGDQGVQQPLFIRVVRRK